MNAVSVAETAVRGSDALITATVSTQQVFDPEWLEPGVHTSTVGSQFKPAHDLDPVVAAKSDVAVTDSVTQVENYETRFFMVNTPHRSQMIELSDIISGSVSKRTTHDETTLFCSVCLKGTEACSLTKRFAVMKTQIIKTGLIPREQSR